MLTMNTPTFFYFHDSLWLNAPSVNNGSTEKRREMSKSIRKHVHLKYGGSTRESWKDWKSFANRYNRRLVRHILRRGGEVLPKDKRLGAWDFDFCKWYYSKEEVNDNYKLKRK